MIFVDTNVFMYAVGTPHPHRQSAIEFFVNAQRTNAQLATSAEVLQELMHAYIPVARYQRLEAAMTLVDEAVFEVWPLEKEDVTLAMQLENQHRMLSSRDLCHLASCRRREVSDMMTFDQALRGAFGPPP